MGRLEAVSLLGPSPQVARGERDRCRRDPTCDDIEFEIFDSSRMRGDLIEVEFARFETQNEMDARDEPTDEMGHFLCRDRKRVPS